MVIQQVVKKLWETQFLDYREELNKVEKITVQALYDLCIEDINRLSEKVYKTRHHALTILETTGCQHQIRNNCISGCSFCNWDSDRMVSLARLKQLREKDVEKYAQVVRYSFTKIRGEQCNPSVVEQLSVHDIFDERQFPEEVFDNMFIKDSVYSRKPDVGIISARADNVSEENVVKWKKAFRLSLTIGIGVECGNEWVRNHWLNKNVYNDQIEHAVDVIKANGAKSCANIILGIPGVEDRYSLMFFVDTLTYVFNVAQFDYVLISPLINKKYTFGTVLPGGESTISLELLENALYFIYNKFSDHIGKITFSPDNFDMMQQYFDKDQKERYSRLISGINNMGTVFAENGMERSVIKNTNKLDISVNQYEIREHFATQMKEVLFRIFGKTDSHYFQFRQEIKELHWKGESVNESKRCIDNGA